MTSPNSSQNYFLPSILSTFCISFTAGWFYIVKIVVFTTIPYFLPFILDEFIDGWSPCDGILFLIDLFVMIF